MLLTKTNPVGIDIPMQKLQSYMHDRLISKWAVADNTAYRCYGRAYRNQTADGYIAENYEGAKNYKEVYWDSSLTSISFFGITPKTNFDAGNESPDVHLVFFVNLEKIKPLITHRADEEIHKDVINVINEKSYGFMLQSIDTGIENILREYPGSRRDDRLKFVDMHPTHCFRLNFKLNYNINNC